MEDEILQDELLISLVEKFTFLYNKKEKDFKNKLARKNAWVTIGSILNIKVEDCEQRWTILRHRYTAEKRREKTQSHSGAESYVCSNWKYYKQMGFLDRHIVSRRTTSNVKAVNKPLTMGSASATAVASTSNAQNSVWNTLEQLIQTEEPEVQEGEIISDVESIHEDVDISVPSEETQLASNNIPCTSREATSQPHTAVTSLLRKSIEKRRARQSQGDDALVDVVSKSLGGIEKILEQRNVAMPTTESAEDHFGRSVAAMLGRIRNTKRRRRLQSQIMNLLSEAESDSD